MKTIYLHIGTFKTGTTSIHDFLNYNREFLKNKGYLVPHYQAIGPQFLPLSLLRDHAGFKNLWTQFKQSSQKIWEKTLQEIEASPLDKVIISSEFFCDFGHEGVRNSAETLKNILKTYLKDYDVKVICYVRPILPYSLSFYKEQIKIGRFERSYTDTINRSLKYRSIHLFPSYYLDFFADVFGKENMIVKTYERKSLVNQSSVDDFLSSIGISDLSDVPHHETVESNLSIPNELINLKRAFNFAGIKHKKLNRIISDILIRTNQKNISDEVIKKLQKEYDHIVDSKLIFSKTTHQYSAFEHFQMILQSIIFNQNREIRQHVDTNDKKTLFVQFKELITLLIRVSMIFIKVNRKNLSRENQRFQKIKKVVAQENKKLYDEYGLTLDSKFDFPDMHNKYSAYELFHIGLEAMIIKQNINIMKDHNITILKSVKNAKKKDS
jgi:hypothetical protein